MYMMDKDMLRRYVKDSETNKEEIALAAILLLGADNRIMSVPPLHKTESIFRVFNENLAHVQRIRTGQLIYRGWWQSYV